MEGPDRCRAGTAARFSKKVGGRITAPLLHITTLFITTSFPFCLNYITILFLMTPINPSAFQLRLILRVQCLRSWRMEKECTQSKINVNIWERDKQFLREKTLHHKHLCRINFISETAASAKIKYLPSQFHPRTL